MAPRGRIHFIDPPHHVEADGTHVYPEGADRVLVYRTGAEAILAQQDSGSLRVHDLGEGRWTLDAIRTGDFVVSLGDRDALLGRVASCELFEPTGVTVVIGARTWNLFEPAVAEALRARQNQSVRIECPSEAIADQLVVDADATRAGKAFDLRGSQGVRRIDGGNFGCVAIRTGVDDAQPVSALTVSGQEVWLRGVISRSGSSAHLADLLQSGGRAASAVAIPAELSWLRLHLTREQRR